MIKKVLHLIIILLFLVGSCVLEEVVVNNYLNDIDTKVAYIQGYVSGKEDINTSEILSLVQNLEDNWDKKERVLCLIVNHKDIEDIGLEISRMKSNCATNQIEDFNASLALIRFYTQAYHHVMGTNVYNVL